MEEVDKLNSFLPYLNEAQKRIGNNKGLVNAGIMDNHRFTEKLRMGTEAIFKDALTP